MHQSFSSSFYKVMFSWELLESEDPVELYPGLGKTANSSFLRRRFCLMEVQDAARVTARI